MTPCCYQNVVMSDARTHPQWCICTRAHSFYCVVTHYIVS